MPLKTKIALAATAAGLVVVPFIALGGPKLIGAPVTQPRPALAATVAPEAIAPALDEMTTGSIPASAVAFVDAAALSVGSITRLRTGLDAVASGDIAGARKVRDALPADSLDRQILAWAIALGGGDRLPSDEIAATAKELSEWPGAITLSNNAERAIYREQPPADEVVRKLGATQPRTYEGVVVLTRAYVSLDEKRKAADVIAPFWRTAKLETPQETQILREFGKLLGKVDHRFRMERMLYAERIRAADRVAGMADAKELAKAWAAVIRSERNARKLLDAVPAAQRSAGYLFAEARYLRRKEKFDAAAKAMLKAPTDRASLADPDAWWIERRVLSRELLDAGDVATAYKLVSAHAAESPALVADAEFHAGWYALRGLHDAKAASEHFAKILTIAEGPISRSRAYYWLGRAAEAGGTGKADDYYAKAADYGTCFYGQIAAAKLGRSTINVSYPAPSDSDRDAFARRAAVMAIARLEKAGYPARADILYRDLAQQLTSPGELALLAVMAERRGDHTLALRVGKLAAGRGIDVGALSHPIGAIPATARTSEAGKALAYAIARQESEFNPIAVSGAGARGLLQLLPGTAKQMAKSVGLPYSKERLTTDAGYNATLGAAFLGDQLGRFRGSYVLTFAGYNAGPSRATQWIARYGDPRGKKLDEVVDWIERIPFAETRSYVQRVMENYEVYKMQLSGSFDIAGDLVHGRR